MLVATKRFSSNVNISPSETRLAQQERMTSELFDLKTFFMLGQYQAAINEGGKVKPRNDFERVERDIFVYRAFIEQGNYQVVLDELKGDKVPPPLQAVRALASLMSGKTSKEETAHVVDAWLTEPDFAQDQMVLLIAAIIYERLDILNKAMQCVFNNKLLEAYVEQISLPKSPSFQAYFCLLECSLF